MGKLGAVPVTPRNMYRLVNAGEAVLLYPGGAKEALHQKVRALAIFLPLVSIPSPILLVVYLPGVRGCFVLRSIGTRRSLDCSMFLLQQPLQGIVWSGDGNSFTAHPLATVQRRYVVRY